MKGIPYSTSKTLNVSCIYNVLNPGDGIHVRSTAYPITPVGSYLNTPVFLTVRLTDHVTFLSRCPEMSYIKRTICCRVKFNILNTNLCFFVNSCTYTLTTAGTCSFNQMCKVMICCIYINMYGTNQSCVTWIEFCSNEASLLSFSKEAVLNI